MDQLLSEFIQGLAIADSRTHENMIVFGIRSSCGDSNGDDYVTLDEALEQKAMEITEKDEEGTVSRVLVRNSGKKRVLMISGEEIVGAKQNRVLNTSLLIEEQSEASVPVSCVEGGRWSYRSPDFRSGSSSPSTLRATITGDVSGSASVSGTYDSDQGAVWEEVERVSDSLRSHSPSSALSQVFEDHRKALDGYTDAFEKLEGMHGILVGVNGEIVGMDVFDRVDTMRKLLPKLISSYALNALETQGKAEGVKIERAAAEAFLKKAQEANAERHKSVGLGEDVRISSDDMVGNLLLCEDRILHSVLFHSPR